MRGKRQLSGNEGRGILGGWSREREAQWERRHDDTLAVSARRALRVWSKRLTKRQRESVGITVRPVQRRTKRPRS